ncbi:MAG TPA: type II secretion system minor pseudopilin GspI [Rhodanobacteraceae bacterium]|nr:type II secretion system minor pseudopilin GspI [Rhodanobacteraceae bacterium]
MRADGPGVLSMCDLVPAPRRVLGVFSRAGGNAAKAHGFTLLEVMVALLIVALGLAAAVQLTTLAADNARALSRRTEADWVAMNQLGAMHLAGAWPADGSTQGHSLMAGRNWYWRQQVQGAPVPNLREVVIEVRATPRGPALATLRTLVSQAASGPP